MKGSKEKCEKATAALEKLLNTEDSDSSDTLSKSGKSSDGVINHSDKENLDSDEFNETINERLKSMSKF